MTGYSSRQGGQYVPVKTTQTGFPRSAARSIAPPPTCGAVSAGAGLSTSGNGETVPLAAGVGAAPFPLPAGVSAGAADAGSVGDRAGDGDGTAADGAGVTRTSGVGVSATRAAPKPTATPIPTTSPRTTAIKVRMGGSVPRGRSLGAFGSPARRAVAAPRPGGRAGTFAVPLPGRNPGRPRPIPLVALSLIHISEPTRLGMISYAVFCLKKKKK